ncbi:ABC transporter substrate-binding protein [Desulfobotulus sp.]|uniref:ABC transporter substrate-binding protein n=1 Tax=Desulfobotulus sp. TaxID=1940337 RepID=UPI002A36BF20|nr:ABC transporter substrate-binding protein [Desulfobotulus sp.]MDY0162624.1 ABC transporter substrate-binding protein [Desulfobotulus sp.]
MPFVHFVLSLCLLFSIAQAEPLKVALLPIPDALPFHVAENQGYFKAAGLAVKAIPVASALERDQLMQAGRIHGMINEMAGTANFNRDTPRMQILQIARRPMGDFPLFRVLARPGSDKKELKDLEGTAIGVSRHTIIEYLTDRMLGHAGVQNVEIRSVPAISERFQLLMQGRLEAAVMPDPLAFSAIQQGAGEIANDLEASFYSASVLSFDIRIVRDEKERISAFLKAWNRAARDINENPEAFRRIFIEKVRMPPEVQQIFPIPAFPVAEVPSPAQWQDMMDWMVTKGLLSTPLAYADNISDLNPSGFLSSASKAQETDQGLKQSQDSSSAGEHVRP